MKWDKYEIDFGECKFDEYKTDTFTYLGNMDLKQSSFRVSCGCTQPTYNPETKKLEVGLKMNSLGTKQATVIVDYPEGSQTILLLKANIK